MAEKEKDAADVKAEIEKNANEIEKTEKKKAVPLKKKRSDDKIIKNTIDLKPTLDEAEGKTVVLGWGRMNPITIGHEKLVNKLKAVARSEAATPVLYVTHSQDPKKNPLSYDDKVMIAKKAFGNVIQKSNAKTIIQAAQELSKKFKNLILVVGQDRVKEFETLLNKYNGKEYSFNNIQVVSAGDRDPDADDVTGMSASKMRALAAQGNKEAFIKGLPTRIKSDGDDIYDMVRSGMKLNEELELDEAPLTIAQRRQRAITMRRYRAKIAAARNRMRKRLANKEKLMKRARKKAIQIIRQKVAGSKGASYNDLSYAEKSIIDAKVQKRKGAIERIAKRLLPKMAKLDRARIAGQKKINEEFEKLFENEKYHTGLSQSTAAKRKAHFEKGAKMDDNNPAAYKPAPGDARAKTKTSVHTKRYHQMFTKEGKIKLDRRFRAFRNAAGALKEQDISSLKQQHKSEKEDLKREHEMEIKRAQLTKMRKDMRKLQTESFENDFELLNVIDEIYESVMLEESKVKTALQKKADQTGISYSILKSVYDRGVAAWRTGHRPGTTPSQWGFARVNSFATGGKTRTTADADLWKRHRGKSEEVEFDSFFDLNEQFELIEASMLDKAIAAIHKHVLGGSDLNDIAWQVSRARGVNHSSHDLVNKYKEIYGDPNVKSPNPEVRKRLMQRYRMSEEGGAGERGTKKLTDRYKKDTSGQSVNEQFENFLEDKGSVKHHLGIGTSFKHMAKHALSHIDYDMDGDVDQDDFKKMVPDEITGAEKKNLTKLALKKYKDELKHTRKGVAFEELDIEEGVNDPSIFKAVFLAGGPGSGKSFIVGKTALTSLGFKVVNSDNAFERALAKAGMEATPENIYSPKGQEIRGQAKSLTSAMMQQYINGRLGLVIDGTGKDYAKIEKQANKLRELGYEVAMIFVNTDLETALERNRMRSRSLPDAEVEAMWKDVQKNIGKFQNFFRQKMFIVDNSSGSNYEGAVLSTYKKISSWAKEKPSASSAKAWIKAQRNINEEFEFLLEENQCALITRSDIRELEKFADELLDKYGLDIEFTKHFGDRMSDERNTPCITIKELKDFFRKVYANQGMKIKGNVGIEAVVKDLQRKLNMPVIISRKNNEVEVKFKTIMRKQNFTSPNKTIQY